LVVAALGVVGGAFAFRYKYAAGGSRERAKSSTEVDDKYSVDVVASTKESGSEEEAPQASI